MLSPEFRNRHIVGGDLTFNEFAIDQLRMWTTTVAETSQDVVDLLTCMICMTLSDNFCILCPNAHALCINCNNQLDPLNGCPMCRSPLLPLAIKDRARTALFNIVTISMCTFCGNGVDNAIAHMEKCTLSHEALFNTYEVKWKIEIHMLRTLRREIVLGNMIHKVKKEIMPHLFLHHKTSKRKQRIIRSQVEEVVTLLFGEVGLEESTLHEQLVSKIQTVQQHNWAAQFRLE